jgi:hypothetical protein
MTDTELRERVARIANEICGCATPEQRRRDIALIEAEIDRRVAEERAKLLERLREPSEGMLSAGGDVPCDDYISGGVIYSTTAETRGVWKAMLAQFERENSDG